MPRGFCIANEHRGRCEFSRRHRHRSCDDPTLIAKNQQDAAADFDDDRDEIGEQRKRQAGGRDEALRLRGGGDLGESADQEEREARIVMLRASLISFDRSLIEWRALTSRPAASEIWR